MFTARRLVPVLLVLSLVAVACNSKVTDEELARWSNNEEGLKKIEEIVRDPEQPMDTRVRAMTAALTSSPNPRIRSFIERSPDREAIAQAFRDALLKMMESEKDQVVAKDGLIQALPYLPTGERDAVQQRIAEWAFEGLDDTAPTAKIKEQVEYRILVSQIEDLGPHGARGAALLLSRGFAVDRLFRYLVGIGTDEARKMALAAVVKLHQIPDSQVTYAHLERIQEIGTADAALYLLDLYDGQEDRDIASDAFNRALGMIELPAVRAEKEKVVQRMFSYLRGKSADDRWFAARTIIGLEGIGKLGELIDGFADDKVYDSGAFDPQKSIIDFCETGVVTLKDDPLPVLTERLQSTNRIAQSIAIVCLKALGAPGARPALEALAPNETSLEDFLGDKLTVGILAQNAADGIAMLEELKQKQASSALSKDEAAEQRWHTLVILAKTGDEYKATVAARLEEVRKAALEASGQAPAPEEPKAAEPPAPEEATKEPVDEKPADKKKGGSKSAGDGAKKKKDK